MSVLEFFGYGKLKIYTDGSHKLGLGAWAFIIVKRGKIICEEAASQKKTSSNRMEFQAAINALKSLKPDTRAELYTDSRVMLEALEQCPRWSENGWVKNQGQPIPEVDLLQELHELNLQHRIDWIWVKAHSGIRFNERCDQLCIRARSKPAGDLDGF
ncbi:ribonuclease H family protein [Bdellovibrio sp. HCB209]|uniref:ribonuclease H family protein n=1 Tax=Bdellovibrio sp. HCB209 TaxID=3394354 RepID=UPI0039B4D4BD